MIYPIEPRTRSVVASRFRAGDSVELLAEDYGISPEQVEAALREEWTPSFAEAEARAAAEGACDCVESEVSRLREQVAEEKTTTDRLRLDAAWFQARTDAAEYTAEQLREENARLRGLLREVEWIDASWLAGECPICVRQRVLGHAPDCRLAAALEKDHG